MQQLNEYCSTSPLTQSLEEERHRPFLEAVRRYEHGCEESHRVRLLESVIWTSRSGRKDDRPLPDDVRETLRAICGRYRLFGSAEDLVEPVTYRTARQMITGLFF